MGYSISVGRLVPLTITRSGCGFTTEQASHARRAGRRSGGGCKRPAAPTTARVVSEAEGVGPTNDARF